MKRIRLQPAAVALLVCLLLAGSVGAHHSQILGNPMGVDIYSVLVPRPDSLHVVYVVDFAEVAASMQLVQLDPNGDRNVTAAEAEAYFARAGEFVTSRVGVSLGEEVLGPPVYSSRFYLPEQLSLPILRIVYVMTYPLAAGAGGSLSYVDRNFVSSAQGYRDIVVLGSPGVRIEESDVEVVDRVAPVGSLEEIDAAEIVPRNIQQATVTYAVDESAVATGPVFDLAEVIRLAPEPSPVSSESPLLGRLLDFLSTPADREIPTSALLVVLLLAVAFGALHALTPGHGKTLVAAYLVGSSGTAWHAVLLGLVVTLAHTMVVYALGAAVLVTSNFLLREVVEKYATLVSGLLVVGIGLWMLVRRLRNGHGHDHDHSHHHHHHDHDHEAGEHRHVPAVSREPGRVRRWELVGLGISGGIVPCPDALVVLLLGISLGRTALGLLLVAVFSLGMALTLVALGLVWVYSAGALRRLVPEKAIRAVLVVSPIVISVLGLVIVWSGVQKFVAP